MNLLNYNTKKEDKNDNLKEDNSDNSSGEKENNDIKFNDDLVKIHKEQSNSKFDEEGKLWIFGASTINNVPGDSITIKFASGKTDEYYEWSTSGAGNSDESDYAIGVYDYYCIKIDGKVKKSEGSEFKNGSIANDGGEVGAKVREIFNTYRTMKDAYNK